MVGQDLLYALFHGGAPASFSSGDCIQCDGAYQLLLTCRASPTTAAWSCPAVYADAGVAASSPQPPTWIFATNWYMDGVSHVPSATPTTPWARRAMPLDGAVEHAATTTGWGQVMTILFDPALIGSFEARVTILQETFDYMDTSVGIRPNPDATSELRVLGNPTTDRCVLVSGNAFAKRSGPGHSQRASGARPGRERIGEGDAGLGGTSPWSLHRPDDGR